VDWTARTFLRAFLLVGGLGFLVAGAGGGAPVDVGLGVAAALLGAFGLWTERT